MTVFRKSKIVLVLGCFIGNAVASSSSQAASSSQLSSIADIDGSCLPSLPTLVYYDCNLEIDSRDFIDKVNAQCYMVRRVILWLFKSRNNLKQVESFEEFERGFGLMLDLLSFNWDRIRLCKGQERVKIDREMVNKLLALNESTKKDIERLRSQKCFDLRKVSYLNSDRTIPDLIVAIQTDSVQGFISRIRRNIDTAAEAAKYLEIIERPRRIAEQSAFLQLVPPTYQQTRGLPKSGNVLAPAGISKLSDFDEDGLE